MKNLLDNLEDIISFHISRFYVSHFRILSSLYVDIIGTLLHNVKGRNVPKVIMKGTLTKKTGTKCTEVEKMRIEVDNAMAAKQEIPAWIEIFRERLKSAMAGQGYKSYAQLCIRTGLSEEKVKSWFKNSGRRDPKGEDIITLSRFLCVSSDYLLGLDPEMNASMQSVANQMRVDQVAAKWYLAMADFSRTYSRFLGTESPVDILNRLMADQHFWKILFNLSQLTNENLADTSKSLKGVYTGEEFYALYNDTDWFSRKACIVKHFEELVDSILPDTPEQMSTEG